MSLFAGWKAASRNACGKRALPVFLISMATLAAALVPGDLHQRDPLIPALYHSEAFEDQEAHVPNTLQDAKTKLQAMIQSDPGNAETHRALADVNSRLLEFREAEAHMKTYVEKTKQPEAFIALQHFYHQRLMFSEELLAMQQHAAALPANDWDVEAGTGKYALYQQMIQHISRYGLSTDPGSIHLAAIQAYPNKQKPYLDSIQFLKDSNPKAAQEIIERFKKQFPADANTYLLTRASLLNAEGAFDLLNRSFDPLWSQDLYRAFDSSLSETGKKREYLESLKQRLEKNPVDADAAMRLFHAYHHAGNLMEAQNSLNDFRLLKEQQVLEKKGTWSAKELYWMASLNHKILNHNEAARYYYALYSRLNYKREQGLEPDVALHGLFTVLIAAEDRPIQLSAGNLDYYKDIASMDRNPGFLNGILSLILNGTDPAGEFRVQEDKAHGYYNRAEAMRLVRYTQKHFPESAFLPGMYAGSLRIFERYGMDKLLVGVGEEFFKQFPNSAEILQVGIAVADAYARMKDPDKESRTYQLLLPIAAQRNTSQSLIADRRQTSEEDYEEYQPKSQLNYEFLLNRYIASLTNQGKHLEVVRLYQDEIQRHPDEEALYENFATYLSQNRLFEQEKKLYEQAISRFQEKGWYEKLARWYLRFKRQNDYERLSREIMDIFRGTEIESYLEETADSSQQLYFALNLYAHEKFPLNTHFVQNLLGYYWGHKMWDPWEALSEEYYFLDDSIRQGYLRYLSANNRLPQSVEAPNAVSTRFSGDLAAWKSHFEEATSHYDELRKTYPADAEINLMLADLKRSLGVQDIQNYFRAAEIREHLAKINPSDSAIWTTAGETMADIEDYDRAKQYWEQILKIDPYQPDRYIELATIHWDYYLFDDALITIGKIRKLKKDEALFAYEAGAIYESKRDYKNAIAEYARSLEQPSEMAWNRLAELYQRKRYTDQIRKHLDAHLKNDSQNERAWSGVIRFYSTQKEEQLARSTIAGALDTLKPEPFQKIAETLTQTTRDLGFNDLQERVFKRRIADASSDIDRWNRTLDLARFYEANKQPEQAEATYRRLYDEQPRSAGLIQEIVSYYWRSKQHEKAFSVYKEALSAANPVWKKKYLADAAHKYRERKDYSAALAYARELLNDEPLNAQNFQLVAELLAEQNDYVALAAHYKEGLKQVQQADLAPEAKKQRTAELRRGIIQANVILKDYTAALDQYIEIINRDAESEAGLKEAAEFAAKYGLNQRLLDYYAKTAASSPKDHRWPMVLGRLHLYTGNFQAAVQQFLTAIAIRPERTDFYQQAAESYQRLGQYEQAIQQYEKAYELSFKNKQWIVPIAELHARLGRKQIALELFSETLKERNAAERQFALSQKALDWGEFEQAVTYGKTGLDLYLKNPAAPFPMQGFQAYLQALIRSGKRVESIAILRQTSDKIEDALRKATFETEELRSAQYMVRDVFSNRYPELMRLYYLEEDWQKAHQSVLDQIQRAGGYGARMEQVTSEYLPLSRAAAMAPLEERLLLDLAKHYRKLSPTQMGEDWSRYLQWRNQLISFYTKRHAYAPAARWMEAEYNTYKFPADYRHDLVRMAELYRLAELPERELVVLRKYYLFGATFDLQPEPVHRYLDLLYQRNLTEELKRAAATANLISANYFLRKQDQGLSIIAIQSLHARFKNDPSWQSLQLAMIGREIRKGSDFFDTNFSHVLDLRTVGELLNQPPMINKTLEGDAWFYYAKAYGEYLQWTSREEQAAYYLATDLEGLPTAAARQNQLGSFYFGERNLNRALDHFTFALQLEPDNLQSLDHRARTLFELGRKQEGIELWQTVIGSEPHRKSVAAWHLFLKAAVDYDFLNSVNDPIHDFLLSRVRETGIAGNGALLALYLQNLDNSTKITHVQTFVDAAPAPLQLGQSLLGFRLGPDADARIYQTVQEYLEKRLTTAAGQERTLVRNDSWKWNQQHARTLIEHGAYPQASAILSRAREQFEASEDAETRFAIALLHAKALALSGKTEESWSLLEPFFKGEDQSPQEDRYRRAIESLKRTSLELRLKEEMYSRLLASGRTEDAIYIGLAEVKIQTNRTEEAKHLLQKMIFLQGENLPGFHSAAELFEKHKNWNEAIALRRELVQRKPWNETNRTRLAENYAEIGEHEQATKILRAIILAPSATARDRSDAATVYKGNPIGPPELLAIQRAIGTTAAALKPALAPYAHNLRIILLEQNETPQSELVGAEIYLNPDDQSLRVRLFRALAREGKCLQALETLDPEEQRKGNYASSQSYRDPSEDDAFYDDYSNHPVERLNLPQEQTRELAIRMADCAKQEQDAEGELFFTQMARSHTSPLSDQVALDARIDAIRKQIEEEANKDANRHIIALNIGRNL